MPGRYERLFVILVATFLLAGCSLPISIARIRKGDLSQYTKPLDRKTIDDVCGQFELDGDQRCVAGKVVYAPDFFSVILSSFERGESTHEDVRAKLGHYEYGCDRPTYVPSLDHTYYWCSYDLQGDRVFPIGIKYEIRGGQEIVTGIVATIGDD